MIFNYQKEKIESILDDLKGTGDENNLFMSLCIYELLFHLGNDFTQLREAIIKEFPQYGNVCIVPLPLRWHIYDNKNITEEQLSEFIKNIESMNSATQPKVWKCPDCGFSCPANSFGGPEQYHDCKSNSFK